MLKAIPRGQTSNLIRAVVYKNDGTAYTGLTGSTSGLIIGTIADNEAATTTYTQAATHIQTIATLGTYAAPSASQCRFAEVDSTNHPGLYEFQFADARFAVASSTELIISVSGAANIGVNNILQQIIDPVRGLGSPTAIPNAVAGAVNGLPLGDASGRVLLQPTQTGVTIPTVTTVGTTTNSTNAPTAGDLTAMMKTSVTAAVPSAAANAAAVLSAAASTPILSQLAPGVIHGDQGDGNTAMRFDVTNRVDIANGLVVTGGTSSAGAVFNGGSGSIYDIYCGNGGVFGGTIAGDVRGKILGQSLAPGAGGTIIGIGVAASDPNGTDAPGTLAIANANADGGFDASDSSVTAIQSGLATSSALTAVGNAVAAIATTIGVAGTGLTAVGGIVWNFLAASVASGLNMGKYVLGISQSPTVVANVSLTPAQAALAGNQAGGSPIQAYEGYALINYNQSFNNLDGTPATWLNGLTGHFKVFTPGSDANLFTPIGFTYVSNVAQFTVRAANNSAQGLYRYEISYTDSGTGDAVLIATNSYTIGDGGTAP